MFQTRRSLLQRALASLVFGVAGTGKATAANGFSFLVVGDWGDGGSHRTASAVADAMGRIGERHGISFVISTGDNFYERGVENTSDRKWQTSFENVYVAPSLQVPWYAVLGNHDYIGNISAQIEYSRKNRRWTMPDRYFAVSKHIGSCRADMYFLDTQRMKGTTVAEMLFHEDATKQLEWLERALAASRAEWKIVVGHHPIFSGGLHGDNKYLGEYLKPILDRYGVDMYLCGHDHDLEALRSGEVNYFVSGSGSRSRHPKPHPKSLFASETPGFLLVQLTTKGGTASFFDKDAILLYRQPLKI
ncbi:MULTISPECIES: purple acid phosphatase family protein [Alphaproteobacteria]|uniref:acid phosphatase n=2 Tax=Alphaproteobacteria TaxID=28211 RepID=A0A512HF26_9HYPH|nr:MULTISPECIES: tartrate-resistant acid phosphatase type 5 family protein [Alphaproteobacteria]GEO84064.1 acid phosphatase [Ciceribacter naphthalenivorans]GLR21058.1 acid phosphatase [Ciceribacter naphthalenivorans]GLT03914.1 acid phosphatase [Sphingomonas psychrolutea]